MSGRLARSQARTLPAESGPSPWPRWRPRPVCDEERPRRATPPQRTRGQQQRRPATRRRDAAVRSEPRTAAMTRRALRSAAPAPRRPRPGSPGPARGRPCASAGLAGVALELFETGQDGGGCLQAIADGAPQAGEHHRVELGRDQRVLATGGAVRAWSSAPSVVTAGEERALNGSSPVSISYQTRPNE